MSHRESPRISRRGALALGGGMLVGVTGLACGGGSGQAGTGTSTGTGTGTATSTSATSQGTAGTTGASTATATTGTPAVGVPRDPNAVALVRAQSYELSTVHEALRQTLDLLGDFDGLVRGKTVTIKPNLTGTPVESLFGRSAGELYITHDATIRALTSLLFEHGASRVRVVESLATRESFAGALTQAGWDVAALNALGAVEYENTRNLGSASSYAELVVPSGSVYSQFLVNPAYRDTDVLISLAKLKMHAIGGVTLTMKNLYGMTPLSLYGTERSQGEDALGYRLPMHEGRSGLPGQLGTTEGLAISARVPRTVVDQNAARPIDLAIVDGISAMSGGEGPWNASESTLAPTDPRVIIAGWNAVSTDAVAASVMGFDPLAAAGTGGYPGDNHIALAEQRGLGVAALAELDLRGLSLDEASYPYRG